MADGFDLVIRRGHVVTGDGETAREADVGIRDGRIVEVGSIAASGADEVDARGKLVTPGFVDVHTHYDGQVIWDERTTASSAHGVTTAIMGNCGVGFAPCRLEDRNRLLAVMEGVEDIPEIVMTEGLTWDWESFPDYLAAIERRRHEIDIGAQLPHSALRVFVMGERGANREPATEDDRKRMSALAYEAARAGAIGFATSRIPLHATRDGDKIPSFDADEAELHAIASGLKSANAGVLQAVVDFDRFEAEFATMKRLVQRSGRPLSYSLIQSYHDPDLWKHALDLTAQANAEGLQITAQVIGRGVGMLHGLNISYNAFSLCPTYETIAHLPLAERVAIMHQPDFKARLLADMPKPPHYPVLALLRNFENMFPLGDFPTYEPSPDDSVAAQARRLGKTPQEHCYDLLLQDEGRFIFYAPTANYAEHNLDAALGMMKHPNTILGLGDGGAHYGLVSDSSWPTYMLSYWCRDRQGEKLTLENVVRKLSYDPARCVGLTDRGLIALGQKADINVIDFDKLRLHGPTVHFDLPAGGRRLLQTADGMEVTLVNGIFIRRDSEATGALPGKLVRSAHMAS